MGRCATAFFVRVLIVFFALGAWSASAEAQESGVERLDRWFAEASRSDQYSSIKSDLSNLFAKADDAELPVDPLLRLLQEGAAKRVTPALLLDAVTAELRRLELGKTLLSRAEMYPEEAAEDDEESARLKHLRRISVALQAGIAEQTLRKLVSSASSLKKAGEAISSITDLAVSSEAENETLRRLGLALVRSNLEPEGYASVISIYLKGRLYNLSIEETTRIIVNVLESGGGIIQIDQELSRRGRGR